MFAITGKDGKISAVRIGSLITVAGVLIFVAAIVTFFIDQAARSRPLDIDPPDGVTYMGQRELTATSRQLFYSIPLTAMSVEDVAAHYTQRLQRFDNNTDQPDRCVRSPSEGSYPDYVPDAGRIPYQYRCLFDNSGFNTTQFTEVRIQPGVYNPESDVNTEGLVMIQYEQTWTP